MLLGGRPHIKFTAKICSCCFYRFIFHNLFKAACSGRLHAQSVLFAHFTVRRLRYNKMYPASRCTSEHRSLLKNRNYLGKCALNPGSNVSPKFHKNTDTHNNVKANVTATSACKKIRILLEPGVRRAGNGFQFLVFYFFRK
jgi:hypothetical protein